MLVNLWLGFPYMFLVSTGALQAIPSELHEAARIDGATSRQVFRLVNLPLLLVALTPLLIASFAFNFNNFNNIYLLTGGGPLRGDQRRRRDRHPHQLHVQDRLRRRARAIGLRPRERHLDHHLLLIATISAISFWRTNPGGPAMTTYERRRGRSPAPPSPRRRRTIRGWCGDLGGGTSSRWSRSRSRSSRSSRGLAPPSPRTRRSAARRSSRAASRWTTSARSSRTRTIRRAATPTPTGTSTR